MNNVNLIGRLANEPDQRTTNTGKLVTKFTIAIDHGKDRKADLIFCEAWDKTASLVANYLHKGTQFGAEGSIKTGSYEKDGKKVYTFHVLVHRIHFIGNRSVASTEAATGQATAAPGYASGSYDQVNEDTMDMPF